VTQATNPTTRDQMVRTATALFQRIGYRATSWRRLVSEGGTPWGSAYHHFPGGKEELGVAAIELDADVIRRAIERAFERHADPGDAIRWWFGKAAKMLRDSDFEAGCPVGTIVLEMVPGSPALTAACRAAFSGWTAQLATLLRGRGYDAERARMIATATLTALEGGLMISRVYASTEPLDRAADQVVALL
jgi:TetR/AcrR family transcriptional regulator, lmrAB and yxaGH operons repressor